MIKKNPYNPSFGKKPERFLGREIIVDEILSALDNQNSPWRTTLLIGIRGTGKTKNYLSKYRMRLIDSGYIIPVRRGEIAFALPFTKEFLLQEIEKAEL